MHSLAVTSLAWPEANTMEALLLLRDLGVTHVEMVPSDKWTPSGRGVSCSAMQGIMFGAKFGLFSRALKWHLCNVATNAHYLGASTCVFGAPLKRDPCDRSKAQAWDDATAAFRSIDTWFALLGMTLSFEPVSQHYGCRFITTTEEAVAFVRYVDRPSFKLQIDTGTLMLEHEPLAVLDDAVPLAAHLHISEPDLRPITWAVKHVMIAHRLQRANYSGSVTIEMKATEQWRENITRAVDVARRVYFGLAA
jgi:D-psicose/D-tagatose/L-ribulose 3-epimerase